MIPLPTPAGDAARPAHRAQPAQRRSSALPAAVSSPHTAAPLSPASASRRPVRLPWPLTGLCLAGYLAVIALCDAVLAAAPRFFAAAGSF